MLLADLVAVSEQVTRTSARNGKIEVLAQLLARLLPDEVEVTVDYLAGRLRQGRIGLGWAAMKEARAAGPAASAPSLSILDVDATFDALAGVSGSGSAGKRRALVGGLFARATEAERELLARLVLGELRQGALEGILVESVARAARVDGAALRRAVMLAGEVPEVASAVLLEGVGALERFRLQLLRPVKPMLAQPAEGIEEALSELGGEAALEWKLDGARVQVHKEGEVVRVFTRALHELTASPGGAPEIVAAVRALPASRLILDGEAIALGASGRPLPFQDTMRRFGRDAADRLPGPGPDAPLRPFFFDILHLDGQDLLDRPGGERAAALAEAIPEAMRIPRIERPGPAEAAAFLEDALARGHEGVMAKSLAAPYEAGRRGSGWLKVKRAHTLDLVVLAVEWGSGRRQGWLSNLHLGARNPDPTTGGFVMLGKTFKGMTDEMLAWQTERLLALEIGRSAHVVHVRPELVVEIAFDGVQKSSQYPGGMALRFARVKRYRPDKSAASASTIDEVRAIFARSRGEDGEPGTDE